MEHSWKKISYSEIRAHNDSVSQRKFFSYNEMYAEHSFKCQNCGHIIGMKYVLPKSTIDHIVPACDQIILKAVMEA